MRKMSESSDAGEEKKGEGDRSKLSGRLKKNIKLKMGVTGSEFLRGGEGGYICLVIIK